MDILNVREKVKYYDELVRQYYELTTAIDALKESNRIEIGFMFDKNLSVDSEQMINLPFISASSKYSFRLGDDLGMISTEENIKTILKVNLDARRKEIEVILTTFEEEK